MSVLLNEDEIERIVEVTTDSLDKMLMKGILSQEEYDREIVALDKWASQQYSAIY